MRLVTQLVKLGIECRQVASFGDKPAAARAVFWAMWHTSINAICSGFGISNQLTTVPTTTKGTDFIRFHGVTTYQTHATRAFFPTYRITINQCRLNAVIAVIHHLALNLFHRGILKEVAH